MPKMAIKCPSHFPRGYEDIFKLFILSEQTKPPKINKAVSIHTCEDGTSYIFFFIFHDSRLHCIINYLNS